MSTDTSTPSPVRETAAKPKRAREAACYILGALLVIGGILAFEYPTTEHVGFVDVTSYPFRELAAPLIVAGFVFIAIGILIGFLQNKYSSMI